MLALFTYFITVIIMQLAMTTSLMKLYELLNSATRGGSFWQIKLQPLPEKKSQAFFLFDKCKLRHLIRMLNSLKILGQISNFPHHIRSKNIATVEFHCSSLDKYIYISSYEWTNKLDMNIWVIDIYIYKKKGIYWLSVNCLSIFSYMVSSGRVCFHDSLFGIYEVQLTLICLNLIMIY